MLRILFCLLCAIQSDANADRLVPPPNPSVPPLIAKKYDSDGNNDRVEDQLSDKAAKVVAALKSAVTGDEKKNAKAAMNQMVNVELVFSEQIKQQQINAFAVHGGEIVYIYKAVSYGWNGRVPIGQVTALPAALGDSLLLIKEAKPMKLHMDTATRSGRVRPIWTPGFAGNPSGYDGATNITIAILDTGIDETHMDLDGRKVYWQDFSTDASASPIDMLQHGSHVAGVATGTGASAGSAVGTLSFSDEGDLVGVPSGSFYPSPFELPEAASVSVAVTARWNGGGSATLHFVRRGKGSTGNFTSQGSITGTSPLTLNISTFSASGTNVYSPALLSNGSMSEYAVNTQVANYPASTDGFNKFRGVAPDCNWAGAKVFSNAGDGLDSWTDAAVDDIVANRITKNIKVINLSLGTIGDPGIDTTSRQKINSAVNNGIVVCVAAGNDGEGASPGKREIDDPGRAAMAITVAAANDVNQLTDYTSQGFSLPSSSPGIEEDYKPDVMAPGGSAGYYTAIMSVDSNSADGAFADQNTNDYFNIQGTSMATPFVAGCSALVIDALQQSGTNWNFNSSQHARLVKMLLCATTSESNTNREGGANSPTLQRAATGANGFPAGKDKFEGYGMINPDAAIEAATLNYTVGTIATSTLGPTATDRRVWARKVTLLAGQAFTPSLTNPATGDFDFYLYSMSPNAYGTPIILASSTQTSAGANEILNYTSSSNTTALLVVKRVSGFGAFTISSPGAAGTPPVLAGIESSTLAFVENQTPPTITSSLTVTDSDSANLASATVSLVTNFVFGQDVLSMNPNPQNGVSATYNIANGILSLSGLASPANYQTALRSVIYSNISDTPSLLTRTVAFKVNDGALNSSTQSRSISVTATNDPPLLSAVANQTINESALWTVTNSAMDPDSPSALRTFSLFTGPPGMSIDSTSGVLTWTPDESQGPSTNTVTVMVTDNGSPSLSDSKSFSVVVQEVNLAPVLAAVGDRTIHSGSVLVITNTANDADLPTNTLTFFLPNGPTNAAINPTTGTLTWIPTDAEANTTNAFTVQITDNGSPALNDTKAFLVAVQARPTMQISATNGLTWLNWDSITGGVYTVQFSTNLVDTSWSNLVTVVASNTVTTVTNAADFQKFYRLSVP